jgi:hypothetical protein
MGETFKLRIFPELAFHYRCEALRELEGKFPWLKSFRFAEPDLNKARDHFFKDRTDCINNLERHINLARLAAVNERMVRSNGVVSTIMMAEFYEKVERISAIRDHSELELIQFDRERCAIKQQSEPNSLVASFWQAIEEMRDEDRAHIATKGKTIMLRDVESRSLC